MKILNIVLRILLIAILAMPLLGGLGVFPPPTADMYSPDGWAFMSALIATGYMFYLIAGTALVVIILLVMNKTALAAIILAPLALNILCFHAFADGTLFTASAALAWPLILIDLYFLWVNREKYKVLW